MKKYIVFAFLLCITSSTLIAQKKKELLAEIESLREELSTSKSALHECRKTEKVNSTKVASMETQLQDLKIDNATLLQNMSSFADLSKKKAENLEASLETIRQKDLQLKTINDALKSRDSVKLATFTVLKNALGGENANAKLSLKSGTVYVTIPNEFLFGSNDKSSTITKAGKGILESISKALNAQSNVSTIVEGHSNALNFKNKKIGNWDLSAKQAAAVVHTLQNDFQVNPKTLTAIGKSEYSTDGIETYTQVIIDPKYDAFYNLVKESMQN